MGHRNVVALVVVVIGGRRVVVGLEGGAGKDFDLISIASHVFSDFGP